MTATVRGISTDGRSGTWGEENEYTVVYKVFTDDRNDGAAEALAAFGIPERGSIYTAGNDFDVNAVVTDKRAQQGDSPWEWEVEVTFSTESGDGDPGEQGDNPLNQPSQLSYSFTNRRILIPGSFNSADSPNQNKDFEAGILAPNGELFDPQPEVDLSEPVLTIRKNVQTISGAALMALADSVNSDNFQGAEPRQLRLMAPQAERQWHKAVGFYWSVNYQLAFRWQTWDVQLLNQGSYYWDGGKPADVTSTTPKVKKDENGTPLIVNLTTDGDVNTTATPTFTRIRFYREIPFNSLGLI